MTYAVTISGNNISFSMEAVEYSVSLSQSGLQGATGPAGTVTANTGATINGDLDITDKIRHVGDTNTAIRFPAADTVTVETAGVERVRVNSAGNVGIGTSSPSNILHVASANPTARFEDTDGTNQSAFFGQSGSLTQIKSRNNTSFGSIQFLGNDGTTEEVFMRLDASGNVGIGENIPDYKLDVDGSFGFTPGSSVTPVDNGDVVFELTNNTTLTIKAKGSDGVVRSGTVTLA